MLNQIKKWLDKNPGIYVIVEKNKPKYVLMKAQEYEKIINNCPIETEKINEQIAVIQETNNDEQELVDTDLDKVDVL